MEEESAQVGKTWIGDILLAKTMPLTEGKNNGTEEESAQVGKSRIEDISHMSGRNIWINFEAPQ
jgi:hypothetical protein